MCSAFNRATDLLHKHSPYLSSKTGTPKNTKLPLITTLPIATFSLSASQVQHFSYTTTQSVSCTLSPIHKIFQPFAASVPTCQIPINPQMPYMTAPREENFSSYWQNYCPEARQPTGFQNQFASINPGFRMPEPLIPTACASTRPANPSVPSPEENEHNIFESEIKEVEEDEEDKDEDSLRGSVNDDKRLINGSAYRRRNVYKSIIRHMFSYVRKNRDDITSILQCEGFSMQDIEHAFCKVNLYNDEERKKGSHKISQKIVKNMIAATTIYTYILCETLYAMLLRWEAGKLGKISRKNAVIYREVSKKYYDECSRMLGRGTQGKSHLL